MERTQLCRVAEQPVSPQASPKRSAWFLTAPPMRLDASEIYGLIELLDPGVCTSLRYFTKHRDRVRGLNALVHDLKVNGYADRVGQTEILAQAWGWLGRETAEIDAELHAGPKASQ